MSDKTWKIAGINFDHFHMGDLLRQVHEHPNAEIVGICDVQPERMKEAIETYVPELIESGGAARDGM